MPHKPPRKPLQPHPYAAYFPMMPEEELQELADDIRKNGQRQAIIVNADDLVVDGRNRAVACLLADVEPVIEAFDMDDREVLDYVLSVNIHRRHLTTGQRANIAAKIANTRPGARRGNTNAAKHKPATLPDCSEDDAGRNAAPTQAEAAELLQVSERSVRKAAKVQKQGTPELQSAVTAGDVSVNQAAQIADLPAIEQAPAVRKASEPRPRPAREPRQKSGLAPYDAPRPPVEFDSAAASGRLNQMLRDELGRWPAEYLPTAAHWIRALLTELKL